MLGITGSFIKIFFVLAIIFGLVQLLYYFKFERDGNLSDVDKTLGQLTIYTVFLAALIFVAALYLPYTQFYSDIDLSPSGRETAFRDLVRNQQRMGNALDHLKEVLNFVFLVLWASLFSVGISLGRLWRKRTKKLG